MRTWLDKHGCEPAVFRYHINVDGVTVHVEFKLESEANAFAEAFDEAATGRAVSHATQVVPAKDDVREARASGSQ